MYVFVCVCVCERERERERVSVCVVCVCVCVCSNACVSRDVQKWVLHECTAKGKEKEKGFHLLYSDVCMKCVFESVKFEWVKKKKPRNVLNIHFLFREFQTVILVSKYIISMQRPFLVKLRQCMRKSHRFLEL